ncbi:MAG: hypothetical protein VB858_01310 [Planctomycetaceae bacterium]
MQNRILKRKPVAAALLLLLLTLPGCHLSRIFGWKNDHPVQRALPVDATLAEMTDHLNTERSRMMGWRSNELKISVSGKGMVTPKLKANLSVESPRNLRLVATSLRGKEVDFGSNAERFWFWARAERPDIILTGSHAGLARQELLELPFPPAWLMEALGVVPLDTSRAQLLRDQDSQDRVQLISNQVIEGRPVQRVMTVDLVLGQIVQHSLYDEQSQLIARARMSDFRRPAGNDTASRLPHRIELNWPRSGMNLMLRMSEIDANPQFNAHTWRVLQDPNCRILDLDQEVSQP